ncbi:hypothetical protein COQ42_25090 [Salmonella enterica]|nr:hypothetical protein [Salmonella enterica]EBC2163598.1 hypothetical protein [Salmonella enterica]EBH5164189.1 hypothetical protein [Salmonella enterica]EBN4441703.1 hypothetical protein [Salmonella enterica]ECU0053644.1 hypothetical protein [Salmonella enterica]
MTLNTSQVSYYMTQRKKGVTQHISAMKAGISVRSGSSVTDAAHCIKKKHRKYPGEDSPTLTECDLEFYRCLLVRDIISKAGTYCRTKVIPGTHTYSQAP